MKKGIIVSIFVIAVVTFLPGQSIVVQEAPGITRLVERHIQKNRLTTTLDGWRIQLFATTDRTKLESARNTFINRYPTMPVDWVHASPWYRLRAGAYQTKLEATKALNGLKAYYPDAYLAKDKINTRELLNSRM